MLFKTKTPYYKKTQKKRLYKRNYNPYDFLSKNQKTLLYYYRKGKKLKFKTIKRLKICNRKIQFLKLKFILYKTIQGSPYELKKYKNLKKKKLLRRKLSAKDLYGIINIFFRKRNIIIVFSSRYNKVLLTTSSGCTGFKRRKFQAPYIVKATVKKIISKFFILKNNKLRKWKLILKGHPHKKTRKTLLQPIINHKKINVKQITRISVRSHNGCRPRKIRRK